MFFVFNISNSVFAGVCDVSSVMSASSNTSDEIKDNSNFIYKNSSDYNNKNAIECGRACYAGDFIFMSPGHVFDSSRVDEWKVYLCQDGFPKAWVAYNANQLPNCSNYYICSGSDGISVENGSYKIFQTDDGFCKCQTGSIISQTQKPVDQQFECSQKILIDLALQTGNYDNITNKKIEEILDYCKNESGNLTREGYMSKMEELNNLIEAYKQTQLNNVRRKSQEQLDCENAVSSGASWDSVARKCNCSDNKIWDKEKNLCIENQSINVAPVTVVYTCPEEMMQYWVNKKAEYTDNLRTADIYNKITDLLDYCSNNTGRSEQGMIGKIEIIIDLINKYEAELTAINQKINPEKVTKFECDTFTLAVLDKTIRDYADDKNIVDYATQVKKFCADNKNSTADINDLQRELAVKLSELSALRFKYENNKYTIKEIQTSKDEIESTAKNIKDMQSGFQVSVWRDDEGNFNKSRLVSDVVAGVVLGTAGGFITAV